MFTITYFDKNAGKVDSEITFITDTFAKRHALGVAMVNSSIIGFEVVEIAGERHYKMPEIEEMKTLLDDLCFW